MADKKDPSEKNKTKDESEDANSAKSENFSSDDLGIPILESVVVPGSDFNPVHRRSSTGRRRHDRKSTSVTAGEARLIADKLTPEIERGLEKIICEKIDNAVHQVLEESVDELRTYIAEELKKILRAHEPEDEDEK